MSAGSKQANASRMPAHLLSITRQLIPAWNTGRLSASRYPARSAGLRLAGASRSMSLLVDSMSLLGLQHRGERARIEHNRNRSHLAVADAIPLAGARAWNGRRLQVVDHAHVVAVDEHLLLLGAGHDPAQLLQRGDVAVGIAEAVDRPFERDIVIQQRMCSLEVLVRPRVEEALRHL